MSTTLFISHSSPDHEIAKALHKAIVTLLSESSGQINICYSSSAESGPHGGEEWREWIEQQIVAATTVLIILSRESVTRHWPIWEAAACRGVSLQRKHDNSDKLPPKIIALTYGITDEECPDPFRKEQIFSGENSDDMEKVFMQVLGYHCIENEIIFKAGKKLERTLETYLFSVKNTLLNAPSLVTEAAIQDWLVRLDNLVEDQRWSELESFQKRMDIAFGHDKKTMIRQIDLRLHRRLGDYHIEQRNFTQAIEQLRFARESAPRDVYVLSRLTEALIKYILEDDKNSSLESQEEIEELLKRVTTLDPDILYTNPDSAAVAAKYEHRIKDNHKGAIAIYEKSLLLNPNSYYLADVLGQIFIELDKVEEAKKIYNLALEILNRIDDHNIWSLATLATATLVLNEFDNAHGAVDKIVKLNPTKNQLASIKDGIVFICQKMAVEEKVKQRLVQKLNSSKGH